jgi:DNA replication and repair protein RecF
MNCWKVKKLQTENFRNLKDSVFDFSPGINCILGKNGNGKTNLLEAVFYLTNKKSFRKNTDFSQMVNIEGENPEIIIKSVFESNDQSHSYTIRTSSALEERFLNNKLEKSKLPSSSVFVNPFDSYHFHTSSTFRRHWFDSYISLGDKEYRQILNKFQKSIRFRNSVLSLGGRKVSDQLKAIDEQISDYSYIITNKRSEFLKSINQFIGPTFKSIFSEEHYLEIIPDSMFVHWDKKKIFDFYRHQEELDIKSGMTQVGVHRDDYIFNVDGLNAFEFCSLGQQKMAFLSLIFAYIELFRYKFDSYPIVLIDDVSGELDSQRWKNLIQYLENKDFQVLITTANEIFGKELEKIPASRKFYIEHGTLINHG